jgi:hypothetical protein
MLTLLAERAGFNAEQAAVLRDHTAAPVTTDGQLNHDEASVVVPGQAGWRSATSTAPSRSAWSWRRSVGHAATVARQGVEARGKSMGWFIR